MELKDSLSNNLEFIIIDEFINFAVCFKLKKGYSSTRKSELYQQIRALGTPRGIITFEVIAM